MSQFLRPASDVTTTNVSAGGFGSIDETQASDTDFVIGTNNTTATYECSLTNPAETPGPGTCTVRFRHARGDHDTSPFAPASGGTGTPTVTCAVVEGTTVLVTDGAQNVVDGTFTAREFTFSTSLVTDWTDLRLRFTMTGTGGSGANRRTSAVSWAEIETPDAAAVVHDGTGTPSLLLATASGVGRRGLRSNGTPSLPLLTTAGAGKKTRKGTGTPALLLLTTAGSGTATSGASGSGAASLPIIVASGTGRRSLRSSGAPILSILTASGSGKKERSGLGAPALPVLTANGVGERAIRSTGAPNVPLLTSSGVGRRVLRSTGAPSLPLLAALGSGSGTGSQGSSTVIPPIIVSAAVFFSR